MMGNFAPGLPLKVVVDAFLRTLELGLCVALISGLFGSGLAWLVSRTDLKFRNRIAQLLSVPFGVPCYLLGMAWIVLANPTVGLFRALTFGNGCYGFWGIVWVECSVAFGFVYLEMKSGFDRMDPSLEEAARMSGATPWQVFKTVSFPLLIPSLVNGMCLSFLYMVSSFGVPAILGIPARKMVLTTLIYSQLKLGGFSGFGTALKLSGLLLVLSVGVLALASWVSMRQRKKNGTIQGGKTSRSSVVRLGPWRTPMLFGVSVVLLVVLFLPWIALGLSALSPVAGDFHPSRWTFRNLLYVLTLPDFKEALGHSILLGLSASIVLVGVGFGLGYLVVRKKSKLATFVVELASIPFSVPGSILALILVMASIRMGLDTALGLLAISYAIKYAAIPLRSFVPAFSQVDPALEEASRMCGASLGRTLRSIWWPLLRGVAWSSGLMCFASMITELTMSVLLTGPGAATLGTVLFQLQEYADQPSAASLAWMLLTVALICSLIFSSVDSENSGLMKEKK